MHEGEIAGAGPELGGLFESIQVFRRRLKVGRSGEALANELIRLRHAIDLLEVEFAGTAAAFCQTEEYDEQGSVSPIDWIRHHCRMSRAVASDRVCVGEHLADLPSSLGAVEESRIGFAHLGLIARVADALLGSTTALGFEERNLLPYAEAQSVGRFRDTCHHLRHAGDPCAAAGDERDAFDRRELTLSPTEDGMVFLKGRLDAQGGAVLQTALEPLAKRSGRDDERYREQRLADALVELAAHALDTGAIPRRAGQRAHLQVTTSLETLLKLPGAPAADLEHSLPISARIVERISCDCTLTRVLLGADSAVMDLGRARRVVSGSTRRALNARDRGCQWPGCERGASWTQAHHLTHWSQGGRTDLDNLVLLCHRHHRMVHEGGWQIVRTEHGVIHTIPNRLEPWRTVGVWKDIPHAKVRGPDLAPAA
jgi:hypothetical protein